MKVLENNFLTITNEDNIQMLSRYEDNHFDLAIDDPNFGIKESSKNHNSRNTPVKQTNGNSLKIKSKNYKRKNWDNQRPSKEYFKELFRVSKKQIIWGGNYFTDLLPQHSSGRIIWDKVNGENDFSDAEIAWTNLFQSTRLIRYMWNGMMQGKSISEGHIQQGNKKLNEKRIHPTQKPVVIYDWILQKYAKKGFKIVDPHFGSGSIAVAVKNQNEFNNMGLFLTACDLEKDYCIQAVNRIKTETNWNSLFNNQK